MSACMLITSPTSAEFSVKYLYFTPLENDNSCISAHIPAPSATAHSVLHWVDAVMWADVEWATTEQHSCSGIRLEMCKWGYCRRISFETEVTAAYRWVGVRGVSADAHPERNQSQTYSTLSQPITGPLLERPLLYKPLSNNVSIPISEWYFCHLIHYYTVKPAFGLEKVHSGALSVLKDSLVRLFILIFGDVLHVWKAWSSLLEVNLSVSLYPLCFV